MRLDKELYDYDDLAELFKVHRVTLKKMKGDGRLPPQTVKLTPRKMYWTRDDVIAIIEKFKVKPKTA